MSVVAIHPRTPSPAGPARRRSPAAEATPMIRVTVDLPLVGGRISAELARLLGLVRELREHGADVVTETRLPGRPATDPGLPGLPDAVLLGLPDPILPAGSGPVPPDGTGGVAEPVSASLGSSLRAVPNAATPATFTSADADADAVAGSGTGPVGASPGPLRVLTGPRVVLQRGRPVPFTRLEFDLLVFLARNPRRVFTRLQLLSNVWGYEHAVARTVDVHVRRLRAKVGSVPLVTTVHGVGYRLADDAPVRIDDRA